MTDLQETKDALVKASDLPLSILIVGVGGADFKEMEVLSLTCLLFTHNCLASKLCDWYTITGLFNFVILFHRF